MDGGIYFDILRPVAGSLVSASIDLVQNYPVNITRAARGLLLYENTEVPFARSFYNRYKKLAYKVVDLLKVAP